MQGQAGLFARTSCTEINLGQSKSQLWGQDILSLLAMMTTARSVITQPLAAWNFIPILNTLIVEVGGSQLKAVSYFGNEGLQQALVL